MKFSPVSQHFMIRSHTAAAATTTTTTTSAVMTCGSNPFILKKTFDLALHINSIDFPTGKHYTFDNILFTQTLLPFATDSPTISLSLNGR